jgi:hypothetical protein
MWNNTESLDTISKLGTWGAALLGLLAGAAGFVAVIASNRSDRLKEELKRTPPKLEAFLGFFKDGRLHVVIDSHTRVPFEFQWKIVTTNNIIISGIPLDWTKAYPTKAPQRFNQFADVDPQKIKDNFIELRLDYRSVYAEEIGSPALSGRLVRAYRVDLAKKFIEEAPVS